jgi:hypothetical protein
MNAKREYRINILLSFYWVISGISAVYILFFMIIFLLRVFGFYSDQKISALEKPEKRYAINLKNYKTEKKQRKIVDNELSNEQKPQKTDLLSNQNSKSMAKDAKVAKNPKPMIKNSESENIEIKKNDLAQAEKEEVKKEEFVNESIFKQKQSLSDLAKKDNEQKDSGQRGTSERTIVESKSSSNTAELVGTDMSLSTYAWQWKPYTDRMKERLFQFWSVPPAYFLGLIRGRTYARVKISRSGKLLDFKLLGHYGHESLQQSSEDVLHAIFDLPKLPPDFPDDYLELTITLNYPGSRR